MASPSPVHIQPIQALELQTRALLSELDKRLDSKWGTKWESRVGAIESCSADSTRAMSDFSSALQSDVEAHLTAADAATDSKLLQIEAELDPRVSALESSVHTLDLWCPRVDSSIEGLHASVDFIRTEVSKMVILWNRDVCVDDLARPGLFGAHGSTACFDASASAPSIPASVIADNWGGFFDDGEQYCTALDALSNSIHSDPLNSFALHSHDHLFVLNPVAAQDSSAEEDMATMEAAADAGDPARLVQPSPSPSLLTAGNLLPPSLTMAQLQAEVVDKQYRAAMSPPPPLPVVDELYRDEASPPPPIHDDAAGVMSLDSSAFKVLDQMSKSARADGLVVNPFEELESGSTTLLAEATAEKVIVVGSVSLCRSPSLYPQSMSCDTRRCMAWLDAKAPKFVVYVSFGSARCMPPIQLRQLGMAFASCPSPVLWLIKDADSLPNNIKDLLHENTVADDVAGSKCLVVRGWALHVAILAHPASDGFMELCGWGSTLEVVAAGLPMATWPFFAEQFINEQLIMDVLVLDCLSL